MIEYPLTNGFTVRISECDLALISKWKWYARKGRNTFYAARCEFINGKNVVIYMHREILEAPKGRQVDHEDGNGLHNNRENIRIATHQQNLCNRKAQKNSSTGCKGVYLQKSGKYMAAIQVNRKQIYLGMFSAIEEAAAVRFEAAKKYHGEFASA